MSDHEMDEASSSRTTAASRILKKAEEMAKVIRLYI